MLPYVLVQAVTDKFKQLFPLHQQVEAEEDVVQLVPVKAEEEVVQSIQQVVTFWSDFILHSIHNCQQH